MTIKNFLLIKKLVLTVLIKSTTLLILISSLNSIYNKVEAIECNHDKFVYGNNEIIDQLMVCSLSKSYDLDLTPQGEYIKTTSRALVDQGLSNKTTILYAKLNGLWSAKRTKFIDSAWKCQTNETKLSSIIEFNGLSLEVIERVDIPLHRNQHKLSIHKPCKTFDLPVWMCRTTKPIYRTTKTWVNSVYLNVTLSQAKTTTYDGNVKNKPILEKISTLFTCPETFKQKITHSPSAMYILAKYMNQQPDFNRFDNNNNQNNHQTKSINDNNNNNNKPNQNRKRNLQSKDFNLATNLSPNNVGAQDGKGPAVPPYHNSVNLIMNHLTDSITKSINQCIDILDLDLTLMNDYGSFKENKLNEHYIDAKTTSNSGGEINTNDMKCSDKYYISQRIELANQASTLVVGNPSSNLLQQQQQNQAQDGSQMKRSQYTLRYPDDPNQLLNPYSYYNDNEDRMIDDN